MLNDTFKRDQNNASNRESLQHFKSLIQLGQYVGDVYAISYESSTVLIHDYYRQKVGGIPSLCFLLATRVQPDADEIDYHKEDSSVILLRVMDSAPTPNGAEAERIRFEAAQRMSGENKHWDETGAMDANTHHLLSFGAIRCRVIGTFFLDKRAADSTEEDIVLRFGSDLSNYYPNRGLKVYKPNDKALQIIVNYRDPNRTDLLSHLSVPVGEVRYASTNRSFQGISNVTVDLMPGDLLRQKTALFGMTRTGKSNSTKIILQSVFNLRFHKQQPMRIGQIVFDPNGEYANENVQDNNSAIKNVWKMSDGKKEDVVTYGITKHPNDPDRQLMLLNFYADENLQVGKEILDSALVSSSAIYVNNFRQVEFFPPDKTDTSASKRYTRRVLAYRSLLAKAGFDLPKRLKVTTSGLFNKCLLQALKQAGEAEPSFASASATLEKENPSWADLATAFTALAAFIKTPEYNVFEGEYINRKGGSGNAWADEDFKKILGMFAQPNGSRLIGALREQHTSERDSDYAPDIYEALKAGKLVIVDQSSGEPRVNKSSADRIIRYIFSENQKVFRAGSEPPDILIYVEEAHNLLPTGTEMDLEDIWVRTAKEGAKYRIGMVYATQEVSSIQRNILKNTANWFIGHLNNTDETRELCKYYDFDDFEPSIRRAQDKGFMRVKTLSNLFVIPVQISKFEIKEI